MTKNKNLVELYQTLCKVINDDSIEMTLGYIKDVERILTLFAKIYLSAEIKQAKEDVDIIFEEEALDFGDEDTRYTLGRANNGTIMLCVGALHNVEDIMAYEKEPFIPNEKMDLEKKTKAAELEFKKHYFSIRNQLVYELILTLAHEFRHIIQERYLDRKELGNEEKEFYKMLLGKNADSIVSDFFSLDENALYIVLDILELKGDEFKKEVDEFFQDEGEYLLYSKSPHEKDARRYSIMKMLQFKKDVFKLWKTDKNENYQISEGLSMLKSSRTLNLANIKEVTMMLTLLFMHEYNEEMDVYYQENSFNAWFNNHEKQITIDDLARYFSTFKKDKNELFGIVKEDVDKIRYLLNGNYLKHLFGDLDMLKEELRKRGLDFAVKIISAWEVDFFDENESYAE